jgi:hypothetical protein
MESSGIMSIVNNRAFSEQKIKQMRTSRIIYFMVGIMSLLFSFYFSAKAYVEYYKLKELTSSAELFFPGSSQLTGGILDMVWINYIVYSTLITVLAIAFFALAFYSGKLVKALSIINEVKGMLSK